MKVCILMGHWDYEGGEVVEIFEDIEKCREYIRVKVEKRKEHKCRNDESLGYDWLTLDERDVL